MKQLKTLVLFEHDDGSPYPEARDQVRTDTLAVLDNGRWDVITDETFDWTQAMADQWNDGIFAGPTPNSPGWMLVANFTGDENAVNAENIPIYTADADLAHEAEANLANGFYVSRISDV